MLSRLDDDAGLFGGFQLRANILRGGAIRQGPRLDAIVSALGAKIGLLDSQAHVAEQVGMRLLQPAPLLVRECVRLDRGELNFPTAASAG